jgi:hypothetical protein
MQSSWTTWKTRVTVATLTIGLAITLPTTAATQPQTIGEDGTILGPNLSGLLRLTTSRPTAAGAGSVDVAIVASAAGDVTDALFTDVQSKLFATGRFDSVTVIHAGLTTPQAADLLAFDAVLVWSNFDFDDPVLLGDRLADYVDSGGGVVAAVFANTSDVPGRFLGGRWASADYTVISSQLGNLAGSAALGTVNLPSHPLVAGVTSFAGGPSSFRPDVSTPVHAFASIAAQWDDGSTLVAVRDDLAGPRVDLGFYPPSDDVNFLYWDTTTDGVALLADALSYATGIDPTDVELRLVPLIAPSGLDATTDPDALPGQLCSISPLPSTFTLELWTSDIGVLNTGVTGFFADLAFDPNILQVNGVTNGASFPILSGGSFDNIAGTVTNFGGLNQTAQGIEPQWAKLGHVQFTAIGAAPTQITSAVGAGGVGVFGRPPPPPAEIRLGAAEYGCPPLIPTVSQWGMIVRALLVLTAGTILFRKRCDLTIGQR